MVGGNQLIQDTLINAGHFELAQEPGQLRADDRYQQIRSEINRRQSLFDSGTDWERVYELAAEIATTQGVDLLVACYFSVAACKTRGVAGTASGLELILVVMAHSIDVAQMAPSKRTEILNWAIARMIPELKDLPLTQDNQREWYRCEYACQQLYELMHRKQPELMPNLDSVGFQIFEALDKNGAPPSAFDMSQIAVAQKRGKRRFTRLLLWLVAFTGVGSLSFYMGLEDWLQVSASQGVMANWQRFDKVFELPQQPGDELKVYPEQQDYLLELDKFYQRFAQSRTQAANLRLSLQHWQGSQNNLEELREQAKQLDTYASSLSPFLGRTYFIEGLINSGQLARAEQELTLLDKELKALLIKRSLLARSINTHQQQLQSVEGASTAQESAKEQANTDSQTQSVASTAPTVTTTTSDEHVTN